MNTHVNVAGRLTLVFKALAKHNSRVKMKLDGFKPDDRS